MIKLTSSKEKFENIAKSGDCGCATTTSCCDETGTNAEINTSSCCGKSGIDADTALDMNVTIDGQIIAVIPSDKNIVDVANRAKIGIGYLE